MQALALFSFSAIVLARLHLLFAGSRRANLQTTTCSRTEPRGRLCRLVGFCSGTMTISIPENGGEMNRRRFLQNLAATTAVFQDVVNNANGAEYSRRSSVLDASTPQGPVGVDIGGYTQ